MPSPAGWCLSAQTEWKINQMLKPTIQKIFCVINMQTQSSASTSCSNPLPLQGRNRNFFSNKWDQDFCLVTEKNQLTTAGIKKQNKKPQHLITIFLEQPGWLQIILHNCVKSPLRITLLLHSRVPELKRWPVI